MAKVGRGGPKDGRAVKAPVAGDRDGTLSCSCPAEKSKNFVPKGGSRGGGPAPGLPERSGPDFANPDGTPLKPDSVSRTVSRLCRRLGLPKGASLHGVHGGASRSCTEDPLSQKIPFPFEDPRSILIAGT